MEATYYIDAILEFELEELPLVADRIQERPGQELPLTFDELGDYDDFINNVCGAIESVGFEIVNEYQSLHSYSYYIDFLPIGARGGLSEKIIQIRFRVSDHGQRNMRDSLNVKRVFKSFTFGSERYPDRFSLVDGVIKACDGLKKGDISILERC